MLFRSMKELKEALAWNYDKGLDAQSAGDMTEMIMKAIDVYKRQLLKEISIIKK